MLITHIAHKHLNRAVYEKGGDGGASKAQAKAQQQAIDLQREQWNTVMNNLKPYAGRIACFTTTTRTDDSGRAE